MLEAVRAVVGGVSVLTTLAIDIEMHVACESQNLLAEMWYQQEFQCGSDCLLPALARRIPGRGVNSERFRIKYRFPITRDDLVECV